MSILKCDNLTRKIKSRTIVKDITLEIEAGEVFGFLGPNGAGKTTTIRMITGLIKPTNGDILVDNYSITKDRTMALKRIGAIVENPEMYPYLTGLENLKQIARIDKRIKENRLFEVLERVGLKDRIHDKVKTYSLGMKQRLGVAQAILHDPRVLILDEPTNGLDPAGIIEFRNMVRSFAKDEGMAVFISSHILSEIEQICDRIAIINKGEIKALENMSDVHGEPYVELEVENIKETLNILDAINCSYEIAFDNKKLILKKSREKIPQLVKELSAGGARIQSIVPMHECLEEKFMKIVGGN